MNSLNPLANLKIPKMKSQSQVLEENLQRTGAKHFVSEMARALKIWRMQNESTKADEGKELLMKALLNGYEIDVNRLSAIGLNSVQIEGHIGRNVTMVVCHQSSVQFVCSLIAKAIPEAPRRVIGFVVNNQEQTIQ